MKRYIFAAFAAVAVASCAKQEPVASTLTEAIYFTSGIESRVNSDSEWDAGDRIGISYINSDSQISSSNVEYTADKSGSTTTFTVAEGITPICYPNTEEFSGTVVAYHPYNADFVYGEDNVMDISDQSTLSSVDYMEAAQIAIDQEDRGGSVAFTFDHMHTLVTITLTADDSVESLSGLTYALNNVQVKGAAGYAVGSSSAESSFGSISTATIELSEDKKFATIEMVLFPTTEAAEATLCFYNDDKSYTASFAYTFYAGKQQSYAYKIGQESIKLTDSIIESWFNADSYATDILTTISDGE